MISLCVCILQTFPIVEAVKGMIINTVAEPKLWRNTPQRHYGFVILIKFEVVTAKVS